MMRKVGISLLSMMVLMMLISPMAQASSTAYAQIGLQVNVGDIMNFTDFDYSPSIINEVQDVTVSTTFQTLPTTVILELYGSTNYTVTDYTLLEYYLTIDSDNYTAHDTVTWKWYAINQFGRVFESAEQSFIVVNRLPSVTAPYVSPEDPMNDELVMCLGGIFSDPDAEDTEEDRDFAWFMDDVQIVGEYTSILDIGTISHEGEELITCKVRVNDGYGDSSWIESSNFATLFFTAGFYEQHQASYVSGDLDNIVVDLVATMGVETIYYVPIIIIFIVMTFIFRFLFINRFF